MKLEWHCSGCHCASGCCVVVTVVSRYLWQSPLPRGEGQLAVKHKKKKGRKLLPCLCLRLPHLSTYESRDDATATSRGQAWTRALDPVCCKALQEPTAGATCAQCQWFAQAAAQGRAEAQHNLSMIACSNKYKLLTESARGAGASQQSAAGCFTRARVVSAQGGKDSAAEVSLRQSPGC